MVKAIKEKLSKFKLFRIILNKLVLFFGSLALFAIALWQLIDTLQDYVSQPTNSLLTMEPNSVEAMPIVTFCRHDPLIAIDYPKLQNDFNISERLAKFILLGSGFLPHSTTLECFTSFTLQSWPDPESWQTYKLEYENLMNNNTKTFKDQRDMLKIILTNYSVNIEDIQCEFNGQTQKKCGKYFSNFLHIQNGMCLTLNGEGRANIEAKNLVQFAHSYDRRVNQSCWNYWKVFLSDTRDTVLPLYGTDVALEYGKRKSIAVTSYVFTRIKECTSKTELSSKYSPTFVDGTEYPYSLPNCILDIIVEKLFIKPFKCLPLLYDNPDNLPRCDIFMIVKLHLDWFHEKSVAAISAWYWPDAEELIGRCQQKCETHTYTMTVKSEHDDSENGETTFTTFRFESEQNQRIEEQEKYTIAGWFGTIGGILGLWLGFSFFTLFTLSHDVWHWFKNMREVRAKRKAENLSNLNTFLMVSSWKEAAANKTSK